MKSTAALICAALAVLLSACTTAPRAPHGRVAPALPAPAEFWLDLVAGDEVADDAVLADLATAGAIFVGEAHTVPRHHALQLDLLQKLFRRQVPLVLCLEPLEARDQPALDRYYRGDLDFATLAAQIDWPKQWANYADYRHLCEFARAHRIPLRALNAPADTIRAVSRGGGLAQLPPALRAHLPAEIYTDDPVYERLMNLELAQHLAMDPTRLRPVFEAQAARDETMAAAIVAARRVDTPPDQPRTAFVVLGAGHMRFGLGTAERVRRRDPGILERLVLLTDSGQGEMTAAQKAQTRDVTMTHADFRAVGRPPADYLRVWPLASRPTLPPGHPPLP